MNKALAITAIFSLALISNKAIAQNHAVPVYTAAKTTSYRPVSNSYYQPTGQCCNSRNATPHALPAPTLTRRPMIVYRPLVPISPVRTNYYYGRGIIGQPKAYIPGQPVRNFIRYLSP